MLESVQKLVRAARNNKKTRTIGNHSFKLSNDKWNFYYHFTVVCLVDFKNKLVAYDNGGYNTMSTKRTIRSYREFFDDDYIECDMSFLKSCE